tara:strand:+ start:138 stop:293 length:156 start_codon:yes stop_codon:yes gene_type:complete
MYISGEDDINPGDVGGARKTHDWYTRANQLSEWNAHNLHTQEKFYSWKDII